ncbi:hypothetical protein OF83DRAFT_1080144 [Amylostereum chailletii]|nr:hypothetical protein OF83DRAFT_1080144 [Amylostereum chailletii]
MSTHATPSNPESNTDAFAQAFAMIIFSEIGDKTFLIAAILAMRQPRLTVFAGAFGSLVVMSILSAALGHILPALVPKRWTQFAAAILFLCFSVKMFMEGKSMPSGSEHMMEEMKEAQEEIEEDAAEMEGGVTLDAAEEGQVRKASPGAVKSWRHKLDGARNLCSLFLGPVFVQAFILTFLGEWGDRSQIATIVLAAAHNVYLVTIGTIVGHSCCTALAVVAGRYISTKVSAKHVTLGGAMLFFCFGWIHMYAASQPNNVDILEDHIPV